MKFNVVDKGYSVEEVDSYIYNLTLKYEQKLSEQKDRVLSLRNELNITQDKLKNSDSKDKEISKALFNAVSKAEKIEASAKNLYDLEIKRIRLLYSKWGTLIERMKAKTADTINDEYTKLALNEFDRGVKTILDTAIKIENDNVKNNIKKASDDYVKNLLNKMDYVVHNTQEEKPKVVESSKLKNLSNRLSALSNVKNVGTGKKSMMEDYLSSNVDAENNAYAKNITHGTPKKQESGFDINEALNTKEDLDEIMKAFDFYAGDKKNK